MSLFFILKVHYFFGCILHLEFSRLYFFFIQDIRILNGRAPDILGVLLRAGITPTNRRTAEDMEYQDSPLPG